MEKWKNGGQTVIWNGDIPIPIGFEYKEGEKNEGYVIIDKRNGNEFVWVPVPDINEMVILNGVSTGNHAGKLYATDVGNIFDSGLTGQTYTAGTGLREPDIVIGTGEEYDAVQDNREIATGISGISLTEYKQYLQDNFNAMVKSVNTYKGFYIGRYDTTGTTTTPTIKKGEPVIIEETWYSLYKMEREMYEGRVSVKSSMIWSCQWDHVMRIVETLGYDVKSSRTWGNYSNSLSPANVSGAGSLQAAGYSEFWKAYNIYDLAGNVQKYTMEASPTSRRMRRTGGVHESGSAWPASSRAETGPSAAAVNRGSRVQLYIK